MSYIYFRNNRKIGDYLKPYIVAELNTSHFGDIELAKSMIDEAKSSGCDCVKFQSWSAETLYCDSYYKNNKIAKRVVTKFSLSNDQLKTLSIYASKIGIDFASTPYSIEEARFLVEECGVPFIKIASMELNNLQFLEQLASLQVPLVLSTGMGTTDEIISAVKAVENAGNDKLILLHCTSVYPSDPQIIRLQNIVGLRGEFPNYPIGYSDHSLGIDIPVASVALGACLIEKHFTLDSSKIGMDNQMATEPHEMRAMINGCHKVYEAMGGVARVLCDEEVAQIPKMRRSIVTKKSILEGHVFSLEDIEFKRPGTGLVPSATTMILGRKATRFLEQGTVITEQDFE